MLVQCLFYGSKTQHISEMLYLLRFFGAEAAAFKLAPERGGNDLCNVLERHIQAAVEVIDGEWWHFDDLQHESLEQGVLRATVTFRGLVERHKVCPQEQ